MLDYYLLLIGLVYIVTTSCFFYYLIYIYLSFLEKEEGVEIEEKYKPFVRYDRKTMNIFAMYIGFIFLLPIRLTMLIFGILFGYIPAKLIVNGDKNYSYV